MSATERSQVELRQSQEDFYFGEIFRARFAAISELTAYLLKRFIDEEASSISALRGKFAAKVASWRGIDGRKDCVKFRLEQLYEKWGLLIRQDLQMHVEHQFLGYEANEIRCLRDEFMTTWDKYPISELISEKALTFKIDLTRLEEEFKSRDRSA